ncbi:TPA: single-stranded DNA-binding protein [Candidatus Avacholeplasma faecigallinarum]|nr:single-stranded DNA-binding protein [Candidatus Avacholeplasma faecigallinarum]
MYNYFMLIGRICTDIEIKEVGEGKKVVNLLLAVNRDFKNMDGTITTDFFRVSLWEFLADIANDCLKKGAMVGIKGRLVPKKETTANKTVITVTELVGERIVFFDSLNNPKDMTQVEKES